MKKTILASWNGHDKTVELLLKKGLDVNIKDNTV
jgi:ankyrin repeat protein